VAGFLEFLGVKEEEEEGAWKWKWKWKRNMVSCPRHHRLRGGSGIVHDTISHVGTLQRNQGKTSLSALQRIQNPPPKNRNRYGHPGTGD